MLHFCDNQMLEEDIWAHDISYHDITAGDKSTHLGELGRWFA